MGLTETINNSNKYIFKTQDVFPFHVHWLRVVCIQWDSTTLINFWSNFFKILQNILTFVLLFCMR